MHCVVQNWPALAGIANGNEKPETIAKTNISLRIFLVPFLVADHHQAPPHGCTQLALAGATAHKPNTPTATSNTSVRIGSSLLVGGLIPRSRQDCRSCRSSRPRHGLQSQMPTRFLTM